MFRELIETLLGAPLQHQTSGSRRQIVENPTEEQRRQEQVVELVGNRIALPQTREKLLFETDWVPHGGGVSEFARSTAQMMYLGAASNSRVRDGEGEAACVDKWRELVGPNPIDANMRSAGVGRRCVQNDLRAPCAGSGSRKLLNGS